MSSGFSMNLFALACSLFVLQKVLALNVYEICQCTPRELVMLEMLPSAPLIILVPPSAGVGVKVLKCLSQQSNMRLESC